MSSRVGCTAPYGNSNTTIASFATRILLTALPGTYWLNPVRTGLCRTPTDYPFLGSFTELGKGMLKAFPSNRMDAAVGKSAALKTAQRYIKVFQQRHTPRKQCGPLLAVFWR